MEIAFSGKLTKQQILNALRLINKPSTWALILRMIATMILIGLLISAVIEIKESSSGAPVRWSSYTRLLFTAPILLYFILQPFVNPYLISNRIWKKPSTQLPFSGNVTTAGIDFFIKSESSISYRWEDYIKVISNSDQIILLTANGVLQVFIKPYFQNDADWERANQLINGRVKQVK